MGRVVVREGSNAGVWNQHTENGATHGTSNHPWNRCGDGDRALRRARWH